MAVECLKRLDGVACVAEFAVIIVFDDGRVVRSAQANSANLRRSDIAMPSGYWCDGVT